MDETVDKIDAALANVVTQLSELTAEHGEKAVDLAMFAYQVDAIRQLVLGGLLVCAALMLLLGVAWVWRWAIRERDEGVIFPVTLFGGVPAIVLGGMGVATLASPVRWLAAFGHPELLIATNALKAAGLL